MHTELLLLFEERDLVGLAGGLGEPLLLGVVGLVEEGRVDFLEVAPGGLGVLLRLEVAEVGFLPVLGVVAGRRRGLLLAHQVKVDRLGVRRHRALLPLRLLRDRADPVCEVLQG